MPNTSRLFAAALGCIFAASQLLACTAAEKPETGGAAGMPAPPAGQGGKGGMTGTPALAGSGGSTPPMAADAGAQHAPASANIERASVAADTAPDVPEADYATFIAHLNKFGLELNQAQSKANDYTKANLIYSPLSASLALAMTYAGARNQTATEMKAVLGDTFSGDAFHVAANRLARELRSRATSQTDNLGMTHKVELNLVDSIFVERTLMVEAPFLELLGREYDSGVRKLDFIGAPEPARMEINAWVASETKDKIQDLLPMGSIDELTRFVLVNAVYFYGSWMTPFKHEATADAVFHALSGDVKAPTMNLAAGFDYANRDQYAVAELPYEAGWLRMTIIVPVAGMFEAVRSQVSSTWLDKAVTGLETTLLAVALPKFKLTVGSFSLKSALMELGMQSAFTDSADLTGISKSGGLSIADVLQKAFISVDEDGTEAAAATAVIGAFTSAAPETPTPFIVDRPFLFFIRDKNGAVLFSGQVVDPSK